MSENQKDEKVVTLFGANLAISIFHPSGNSGFHDIIIENCSIEGGRAVFSGGISLSAYAYWNQPTWPPEVLCIVNHTDQASSVHIINTEIVQNAAIDAVGGLGILLRLCRKYTILIRNVTMSGNILGAIVEVPNIKVWWQQYSVYGNALGAGNLGIMISPATPYHSISIEDSTRGNAITQPRSHPIKKM